MVGRDRRDFGGRSGRDHPIGHLQLVTRLGRPHQAEQARRRHLAAVGAGSIGVGEGERAEGAPQGHQADQHPEVADAIDDEGLVGGGRGASSLVVEADQKPGADAHQFPEHEHHRQVPGDHDPEHREAEQRQGLEEPGKPPRPMEMVAVGERDLVVGDLVQFVVHVARGVDVDASGDQGHHHEHQHREGVDVPPDRELEPAPFVERVPVARVGHRLIGGGMAMVIVAVVCCGGLSRGVGSPLARGVFGGVETARSRLDLGVVVMLAMSVMLAMPTVMHGGHRMGSEPDGERRQRQDQRGDDRGGRNPSGVAAVRPHPRPEKQDQHERRQRREPGQSEQQRKLGGEIHERSEGSGRGGGNGERWWSRRPGRGGRGSP